MLRDDVPILILRDAPLDLLPRLAEPPLVELEHILDRRLRAVLHWRLIRANRREDDQRRIDGQQEFGHLLDLGRVIRRRVVEVEALELAGRVADDVGSPVGALISDVMTSLPGELELGVLGTSAAEDAQDHCHDDDDDEQ